MRRVMEHAQELGLQTVAFHCASDPDSLDGVLIPQKRVTLLDGTAPHVYDPVCPGARDTLLSLGDYLEEAELRERAEEIEEKQVEISERFARCYGYLRAASGVARAAACGAENPMKAERVAEEWSKHMPLRGGEGRVMTLFASAITPKGLRDLGAWQPRDTTLSLDCPLGLHASGLMRSLARRAASRGLDAILLADPLEPREIARVLLPAHGLCFVAEERRETRDCLPAESVFDLRAQSESERSYDRNAYELMLQRAVEQLRAAKAKHDELEAFYVKSMDFARWNDALERVLAQTFASDDRQK